MPLTQVTVPPPTHTWPSASRETWTRPRRPIAVPWLATYGAALAGKTVIDTVNRIGAPEFDSRAIIADAAPQARYVRAFNSLGWENFADPMPGTNMFFAADPDARATAEELIRAVGLEPAFLGDANATTTVDGLLPLWFALVQQNGGNRRVALRIITEG